MKTFTLTVKPDGSDELEITCFAHEKLALDAFCEVIKMADTWQARLENKGELVAHFSSRVLMAHVTDLR